MKRSVNFTGRRSTVARKAARPEAIVKAARLVGMSDDEIRAMLERAKRAEQEGIRVTPEHKDAAR